MDKTTQNTIPHTTSSGREYLSAPKKTRILHCIRQGQVGGGESHVIDLVRNLNPSAFENIVLAFTDGEMISTLRAEGINCHVIPSIKPFDLSVWSKVRRLIQNLKVDLIHIHGTRAFSNVFFASKALKLPVVYTVHGWSFNEFQSPLRRNIAILTEGFFTKIANTTINVSYANQVVGKKALKSFKSVVIPNGIDTSRFSATTTLLNSIRQDLQIPEQTLLIGFVARMTEQKDPLTLLEAFNVLQKKTPNKFSLLFVGDGELKADLINRAKELNLTNIFFEKFRKDIPNILKQLDVFCLPSLWEGLSLGLLEAMSMGKAIVATTVDGTQEVVTHNENGLLFNPRDTEELVNNLIKLAEDSELKHKIEQNAMATVFNHYSLISMIKKTEEVYLNVIHK